MTGFFVFLLWWQGAENQARQREDDGGGVFLWFAAVFLTCGPWMLGWGLKRGRGWSWQDATGIALVAAGIMALVGLWVSWWWWLPISLVLSLFGWWLIPEQWPEEEPEEVEARGPRYRFS